ncbi:MAG: hypothetical protein LBH43_06945 [Treponema sp.]|jgi:hypothetical protein|nr:hypothetical protein [Treponema sp.]
MKNITASCALVFMLFSCASPWQKTPPQTSPAVKEDGGFKIPSLSRQAASGHWILRPQDNCIIIIGVSSRLIKHDSEIEAAKEDAARKAAMYHGISGSIESVHSAGAGFFDYVAETKIELDYDTGLAKYIEKLVFDPGHDVVITDEAVFVRFTYPAEAAPVDFTSALNNEGRPNWAYSRSLPQIEGYVTAVGFAINQVRLKDTVRKSTEAAVARMIEEMSTHIESTDKAGTGTGAASIIQTRSGGRLNNFQIIEFWIDPKTGYVYTLAAAKQIR